MTDDREAIVQMLKKDSYTVNTLLEIDPSIDIHAISSAELLFKIKKEAADFHHRLMEISDQTKMSESVNVFFKSCDAEYQTRRDIPSPKVVFDHSTVSDIYKDDVMADCFRAENSMDIGGWLKFPYFTVVNDRSDLIELCVQTGYKLALFRGFKYETLLHVAVSGRTVNIEILEKLLCCIPVDTPSRVSTSLHELLRNRHISEKQRFELVQLFLIFGASLGQVGRIRVTAYNVYIEYLQMNLWRQDIDVTKGGYWMKILNLLFISGVTEIDGNGKNALHYCMVCPPEFSDAMREKWVMIMDYLIEKGAKINVVDKNGLSIMHSGVSSLNMDVLSYVLHQNCNVNIHSKMGLNPIYFLCLFHKYTSTEDCLDVFMPLLQVLVSCGTDINTQAIDGSTPLHHCAATMNVIVCEFLLQHEADLHITDYLSRTALHYSVRNSDSSVIPLLHKYAANISAVDKYGYAAIHYACMYGNNTAVKSLIECGAELLMPCHVVQLQPIHLAIERGDAAMIDELVSAGVSVHDVDKYGASPLHYAGFDGMPDVTGKLIEHGGNIDSVDGAGNTPLSFALMMGQYKVAQLLTHDQSKVKFGDFDSFPNRPPISELSLDKYCQSITEELKAIGDPLNIARSILLTPGLMRVDFSDGENTAVRDQITLLANELATCVGQFDERFKGNIFPVGSSSDGCKAGYPDEFDFLIRLEFFEKLGLTTSSTHGGFLNLNVKPENKDLVSDFLSNDGCYLASFKVYCHFRELLMRAWYHVHRQGHGTLQTGYILLHQFYHLVTPLDFSSVSKLLPFNVTWRGANFKAMEISFDINPILFYDKEIVESIHFTELLSHNEGQKLCIFPKTSLTPSKLDFYDASYDASLSWSYSFVYMEKQIFKRMSNIIKDAFTLCKLFRMEPLLPAVLIDSDSPQEWKAFVHSETASQSEDEHAAREISSIKTDSSSRIDQDELIHSKCQLREESGLKDECRSVLKAEGGISIHHGESQGHCSTTETGILMIDQTLIDSDSEDEEEVMTTGSCISSYHLKQTFLYELENIPLERRQDQILLTLLPYRVYRKLLSGYERKQIFSFFLPHHNIYNSGPLSTTNNDHPLRLRFCQNILKMMEELGFSENDNQDHK